MKKSNLSQFKEEILSEIAPYHYSKFSFDKNVLDGKYIAMLRGDLENLINNNKRFKLKIDEDLVNNPRLLKLFNLKKIDEAKIIKFFKYSIIQENYLKYFKNTKDNFELLVDELDYNDNKLHVFNIYFIISCGLLDKIETDSLQIFNEDNNVIILFQKYAKILIENINNIILKIKNQDNIILDNKEIFGFGKVFKTFYVLYTNLSDKKYEAERLKFDMIDNSVQKNIASNNALKINIKLNKSENDTNFTKNSEDSIQNLNKEQSYYEKINSSSLEDVCKNYIFSQINDLINDNLAQIKLIEMYKILFGLNFFIPCVDENFSLKFIPVTKALYNKNNNNNQEYGYQEFDCLFKVLGNEDIPMNHVNACSKGLPFVKNIQIRVNSMKNFNQMEFKVYIEDEKGFAIKKNALVLVENKIRFPKNKEKILEYIAIMLKKLNFVIKLIKSKQRIFLFTRIFNYYWFMMI